MVNVSPDSLVVVVVVVVWFRGKLNLTLLLEHNELVENPVLDSGLSEFLLLLEVVVRLLIVELERFKAGRRTNPYVVPELELDTLRRSS